MRNPETVATLRGAVARLRSACVRETFPDLLAYARSGKVKHGTLWASDLGEYGQNVWADRPELTERVVASYVAARSLSASEAETLRGSLRALCCA